MRTIAVDCDLRRIHAWDSESGMVCYKAPDLGYLFEYIFAQDADTRVLFEIVGPIMHREGDARKLHHTHRWMIYNAAMAAHLDRWLREKGYDSPLVATSTAWTRGYTEKERHKIACADARNHDLRECQSMLAFHRAYPKPWVPLPAFLEAL